MGSKLKVLHLASFEGNIGDEVNHYGFYPWLNGFVNCDIQKLEIREFYRNKLFWDQDLVDYINSFDRLIVGGGNYFETWVSSSPTGCSIEFSDAHLDSIKTPIFFNALGLDVAQNKSTEGKEFLNFRKFLNRLITSDKHLVTLRNDGTIKNLSFLIDKSFENKVGELPDSGFYGAKLLLDQHNAKPNQPYFCVNLASDLNEIRFAKYHLGEEGFFKDFADIISQLINKLNLGVVFVSHVYHDYSSYTRIQRYLPDEINRHRVQVLGLAPGLANLEELSKLTKMQILTSVAGSTLT